MKPDLEFIFGKNAPSHTDGQRAAANVDELRKRAFMLQRWLEVMVPDCEERKRLIEDFDVAVCYGEALIRRYERSGPPFGSTAIDDMAAVLRFADKNAAAFKPIDLAPLRAAVSESQGTSGKPKKSP